MGRPQHQAGAQFLLLPDEVQGLVVPQVPVAKGVRHPGIAAQGQPQHRHQPIRTLDEALRLGQNDDAAVVAHGLEGPQGDGISDAAVQQEAAVHLHGSGRQGHTGRRTKPEHILPSAVMTAVIDRLTRDRVGTHRVEGHGIGRESSPIKGIQPVGNVLIAEGCAEKVAGEEQVPKTGIAPIRAETCVIADDTPDLPGLHIATKNRARRCPDGAVHRDARFHQHIRDARGEHAPHGASLHDQTKHQPPPPLSAL